MSLGTRSTPGCLWACHSNGILTLRPARQRVIGPSKKQQLFVSALLQRVVVGQKICTRCSSATPHWPERRTATVPAAALRRDLLLCSSVAAQTDITYRSTTDTEHLRQASVLRAGAYYEEQPQARYTESFKRQFADQSARILKEKTSGSAAGSVPECVCMIAIQHDTEQVLATCDVKPPANVASRHPEGVPKSDVTAAYITNVAVDPSTRGQGIGFQLLEAAAAFATEQWQAAAVYTTVDTNNQAATNLYSKCGFETESVEDSDDQAGQGGPLALLRAELPLKCNIDD